jgi:hypothetical protein
VELLTISLNFPEAHYKLKASRKTEHASIKSHMSAIPDDGKADVKAQ